MTWAWPWLTNGVEILRLLYLSKHEVAPSQRCGLYPLGFLLLRRFLLSCFAGYHVFRCYKARCCLCFQFDL